MKIPFIFSGYDHPEKGCLRQKNYEAHKEHVSRVEEYGVKLLVGGPLLSESKDSVIGSFMLVEAESKSNLENFIKNDPLSEVWGQIIISPFKKRSGSVPL